METVYDELPDRMLNIILKSRKLPIQHYKYQKIKLLSQNHEFWLADPNADISAKIYFIQGYAISLMKKLQITETPYPTPIYLSSNENNLLDIEKLLYQITTNNYILKEF